MSEHGKRLNNRPWKRIYGVDRKYTARVDSAKARGQWTAPKVEVAA
jgi:hypothetical protein